MPVRWYLYGDELPEADVYLMYLLFFEEVTVKEAAQLCGCSRKTIENIQINSFLLASFGNLLIFAELSK